MERSTGRPSAGQAIGGAAALYICAAYAAAMAYYLLFADYGSIEDPAAKISFLVDHRRGLYAVNLIAYAGLGLASIVLSMALYERFGTAAAFGARIMAGIGIGWACLLMASGAVFNMGMEGVVRLQAENPEQALSAWRTIELIADGLGGGGGEALGGSWILLIASIGLRAKRLPAALGFLGLLIGAAGILSSLPALRDASYLFGLLQIPFFAWLAFALLRSDGPMAEAAIE